MNAQKNIAWHCARAFELLGGPAGEEVELTVKRGKQTLSFKIMRVSAASARIRSKQLSEGIVYIGIPTFEGSGIADKVEKIVREHIGASPLFLLLDIRDNPGGRPE
ncbi:hypothetical protein ACFL1X_04025 [Candidatus Hydrogenedentota bacterium]